MNKLLFLLLIALIFGTTSASIRDEWEKAKEACAKIRSFLKKYGIYEDVIKLLNDGARAAAQKVCEKKIPSDVCSDIVTVVGKLTSKIKVC